MGNTSNSVSPLTPESVTPSKPQAVETKDESFNDEDSVQIFVQNIDGTILTLSAAKNASILDCKKSIFIRTGIDTDEQIIYFEGKELKNNKSISDYNINTESNVNLSLKLRGGEGDGDEAGTCCCLQSTGCCWKWTGCCIECKGHCWKWIGCCIECKGYCCCEWTGCCMECKGCCCCEWTGCCMEFKGCCCCEWNGVCCCKCRDNYKCCCDTDACCLRPEAPRLCCPCAIFACFTNSTCGFCCGGGPDDKYIVRKITCMQCQCCGVE